MIEPDRAAAYRAHVHKCDKSVQALIRNLANYTKRTWDQETRSFADAYFIHQEITGRFNEDVRCDARCMNATGPNCECSCGGANHGASAGL